MFNLLKDIDSYQFWEGAKQNKLLIQQSTKSKKYFLYSRSFRVEADEPFKWVESSGKGIIYSFTISHIAGGSRVLYQQNSLYYWDNTFRRRSTINE